MSRGGQTLREQLEYVRVADAEAHDVIAGLARMQTHAGLALTVSDAVDVIRLTNQIIVRAERLLDTACTRIDTLDACAKEPDESIVRDLRNELECQKRDGVGVFNPMFSDEAVAPA